MNRVEEWRRRNDLSQRQVAELIECSDAVVVSAEAGRPIRKNHIDGYVRESGGFLTPDDFTEATRGKTNGKAETGRREIGRTG